MTAIRFVAAIGFITLATSLVACAADGDEGASADEVNAGRGKISGYDLGGPKTLPKRGAQVCPAVFTPVQQACSSALGSTQRSGCEHLCSVPIAPQGKVAGYDFEGFKQLANDKAAIALCPQVITPEQAACERAGGTTSRANLCKVLCSVPIAPEGKAAGFDLQGFKIAPADKIGEEVCAAVLSPLDEACAAVKGKTVPTNDCGSLCSLPVK